MHVRCRQRAALAAHSGARHRVQRPGSRSRPAEPEPQPAAAAEPDAAAAAERAADVRSAHAPAHAAAYEPRASRFHLQSARLRRQLECAASLTHSGRPVPPLIKARQLPHRTRRTRLHNHSISSTHRPHYSIAAPRRAEARLFSLLELRVWLCWRAVASRPVASRRAAPRNPFSTYGVGSIRTLIVISTVQYCVALQQVRARV